MYYISLNTAAALTGLTKRTLWRYIDSGRISALSTSQPGAKTQIPLQDVLDLSGLAIAPEHYPTLVDADRGDPIAQCDLGILLLSAQRPTDAIPWFQRSANAFYPDAMCRLGRAYLAGEGVEYNPELGLRWIKGAARKGHPLAQSLYAFLRGPTGQELLCAQGPSALTALNQALDDIERQTLLNALNAFESMKAPPGA